MAGLHRHDVRHSRYPVDFNGRDLHNTFHRQARSAHLLVWTIGLRLDSSQSKCSSSTGSYTSVSDLDFRFLIFFLSDFSWTLSYSIMFASFWHVNWMRTTERQPSLINDGLPNTGRKYWSWRSLFHFGNAFSRLTRSTLLLLPLFSVHYFLFMWNTKPLLISYLILIHLTVHTISSSLQVKFCWIFSMEVNMLWFSFILPRVSWLHWSTHWSIVKFNENYFAALIDGWCVVIRPGDSRSSFGITWIN
jgi:hypothetical protein